MYDIIELKSKSFDELLAIAEKLEISKPKSYSQDDLVYKILDEQAIKASEQPVEKVKKRGRPRVNKAPVEKEAVQQPKQETVQTDNANNAKTEDVQNAPKKRGRKKKVNNDA
ncbi:MAG: Rho termination factor N-terminal domain-containing protein, partial [Bacteroidales bacterium]|nr:Rho termination factor N-terminal domain-containing protein [Bacteroidales bacterium]